MDRSSRDAVTMRPSEFQKVTVNSLSAIYLWLFFGYLSTYINCDLQRILRDNPYVLHAFGFFTFFFLFTKTAASASGPPRNPGVLFGQTLIVYLLWLLASKTKSYFVFTVLGLLLIHQVTFVFLDYFLPLPGNAEEDADDAKDAAPRTVRTYMDTGVLVLIVATVVAGVAHYMHLQMLEYKDDFSFFKFFVERSQCKKTAPNYDLFIRRTKK